MYNGSAYLVAGKEVAGQIKGYIDSLSHNETALKNYEENKVRLDNGDIGLALKWKGVKWCDSYNDCSGLLSILHDYNNDNFNSDTCYKFMVLYDDYAELNDEEYTNDIDDEYLSSFYIIHDVCIDTIDD